MTMLPTLRNWRSPMDQWQRDFDRAFGRLMPAESEADWGLGAYPVDVREEDDKFIVEAELPGFKREEIDVTLEQGVLTINASRTPPQQAKGHEHVKERRYTRVSRSFRLGGVADESKVEAKLDSGLLTVTIPKKEEVKPRKIEVK